MQAGPVEGLSLAAELLWLSIDPADGGLLAERRRLRRALGVASVADGSGSSGRRAWRRARAELVAAGLIETGRTPRLTERKPAAERFLEVEGLIDLDDGGGPRRDRELFALLAGSGVLARRMGRDRRRAARRALDGTGMSMFTYAGFDELHGDDADFSPGGIEGTAGSGGFDAGGGGTP